MGEEGKRGEGRGRETPSESSRGRGAN